MSAIVKRTKVNPRDVVGEDCFIKYLWIKEFLLAKGTAVQRPCLLFVDLFSEGRPELLFCRHGKDCSRCRLDKESGNSHLGCLGTCRFH